MTTHGKVVAALLTSLFATVASTPAAAQGNNTVNRLSAYGRQGVGAVYGIAGGAACASRGPVVSYGCGEATKRVGESIYDGSRNFANREGPKLQEVGRRAREYVLRRR